MAPAPATVKTPLLAAESLSCAVSERVLFDDLYLVVAPGDLVEVHGPNGSGKSTLLRCLAGLLSPRRGRVRRGGAIDYVGHKSGVCERMTAVENLRWLARLRGDPPNRPSLAATMRRVGLGRSGHDRCAAMSAGQVRRVALARLPLGAADVWLLDEPLTALDAAAEQLLRGMIAEQRARGGAVVCATHRPLDDGRARGEGATLPARTLRLGA